MDIFTIIASFGGGVIGAYLGAVPAFIMTGLFALVGVASQIMGLDVGGNFIMNNMAFGAFLSPAVSFGGGVAAAAFAGRKGKLASGTDVISALNGLSDGAVLAVGGIFGVIGMLIQQLAGLAAGTAIGGWDTPGVGVVVSALIARFLFGKTGLVGKYENGEKKQLITKSALGSNLVLGLGLGLVVGMIFAKFGVAADGSTTVVAGLLHVACFGFSACTLAFTCMGLAVPSTHHITLPAALGAGAFYALTGNIYGAIVGGVIFGVAGSLLGDFYGNALNSHVDTHIDPPACTIVTLTIIASVLNFIAA